MDELSYRFATKEYVQARIAEAMNVAGGGAPAVLGHKTITANGIYNASSDSLDGYDQVTVNVPTPAPFTVKAGTITPVTDTPTISIPFPDASVLVSSQAYIANYNDLLTNDNEGKALGWSYGNAQFVYPVGNTGVAMQYVKMSNTDHVGDYVSGVSFALSSGVFTFSNSRSADFIAGVPITYIIVGL